MAQTDKAASFVMDGAALAAQVRRVAPLASAHRKLSIRLGASVDDEFHALVMLAMSSAAKFEATEEDIVAYVRQQFIIARGAQRGTLAEDLQRVDEITSGLTDVKAENKHLREREEHLARLLNVADGGRWRTDWEAPIKRLVDTARREGAAAMRAAALKACAKHAETYADSENGYPHNHYETHCRAADEIDAAIREIPDEVAP